MNIFKHFLCAIFCLFFFVANACQLQNMEVLDKKFHLVESYKEKLFSENISYEGIQIVNQQIESIYSYAKKCVENEELKIKNLGSINQELKHIDFPPSIQSRLSGLAEELCEHQTKKILCESLKLKTNEAMNLSQEAIKQYREHARMPNFRESIILYQEEKIQFKHVENIKDFLNLNKFSSSQLKLMLGTIFQGLVVGLLVFLFFSFLERRATQYVWNRILHVVKYSALFLVPNVFLLLKVSLIFGKINQKPELIIMLVFAQIAIRSIFLLQLFYWLIKVNRPEKLFSIFRISMNYFIFWILFQFGTYDVIQGFFLDHKAQNLICQLGIPFFSLILYWLGLRTLKSWINFYHANLGATQKNIYEKIYTLILTCICLLQIGFSLTGYNELAYHLPMVCIVITLFFILFKLLIFFLNKIKSKLEVANSNWSKKVNQIMGKGGNVFLLEFDLLFNSVVIILVLISFKKIFYSWGLPLFYISYIEQFIFQGFRIATYQVQPFFLIKITFIVFLINAFGKILAKIWLSKQQFEEDKKFTMNIILHSIIYAISCLVLLDLLGVDASQISFVIGALSVGIGIALRSLISDFLAGVYLIFKKPVHIGDYIEINGVEGQVKKISMLITELSTTKGTIVYVPNEQFLRNNVFNKSQFKKIVPCNLIFFIKKFDDFSLARDIILDILTKYPDVYMSEGLKPQILFHQLDDPRNPVFSLGVSLYLSNIEKKDAIITSIQLETLKLFQERGIETN